MIEREAPQAYVAALTFEQELPGTPQMAEPYMRSKQAEKVTPKPYARRKAEQRAD